MKTNMIALLLVVALITVYLSCNNKPPITGHLVWLDANDAYKTRQNILDSLNITSDDIVFCGDGIIAQAPLEELLEPGIKNRGINGNKAPETLVQMINIINHQPRKIFLEIGTIDLLAKRPANKIVKLIDDIIHYLRSVSPKTVLHILDLPPCGMDYKYLNGRISDLNDKLVQLCRDRGVFYIPVNAYLNEDNMLPQAYSYDGLYLNGAGYKKWAELIKPWIN